MLNICLSRSKYPLGSNWGGLGFRVGTGDWGGEWGFRVGIGFRLSGLRSFTCETYVFLCQSILWGQTLVGLGTRVGTGGLVGLRSFTG